MLFKYQAKDKEGKQSGGSIEAPNLELAVSTLQKKELIIISISPVEQIPFLQRSIALFERVSSKDKVILSRQLSVLFEAKVPVVDSLKIIMEETENIVLKKRLAAVISDIEGGISMSQAFANQPDVFSRFYVNMVKVGEESGRLDEIFSFLADFLERNYELNSKVKNALIYPAFVLGAFIIVMIVMFVVVVPKLTSILTETGADIPFFTKIIIGISFFFRKFWVILLVLFVFAGIFLWRYLKTELGRKNLARLELSAPLFKKIFKEFYLARISDNLDTLLSGGVTVIRSLELSAEVVGNDIYKKILQESIDAIKAGGTISGAFVQYSEMPAFVTQMIKIGEGTGKLNFVLKTIAKFYREEVNRTVDTLVKLIEPLLILLLGGGVGIVVAAILIPIYNIASAI